MKLRPEQHAMKEYKEQVQKNAGVVVGPSILNKNGSHRKEPWWDVG